MEDWRILKKVNGKDSEEEREKCNKDGKLEHFEEDRKENNKQKMG